MSAPAGTCDPGWFCTLGSWSAQPTIQGADNGGTCECPSVTMGGQCRAGTYCPAGSSAPIECDGGSYCDADGLDAPTGLCDAGYYCNSSAIMSNPTSDPTGDTCPKGHYCPAGSAAPVPCPPGTFNDMFTQQELSNCQPCTAGEYCAGYGNEATDGQCDAGWYCLAGQNVTQPEGMQCLGGHQCPQGSPQLDPCESGTYQPNVEQDHCLDCPRGKYCDRDEAIAEEQSGVGQPSHGVVTPKDCPAGFYCPLGTETSRQYPCPVGTFSNTTGLEAESECIDCTPGDYCDAQNLTQPSGKCFAGFYCSLKAIRGDPTDASEGGNECPEGSYCEEGSAAPVDCPKGTYSNVKRLTLESECTVCTSGFYCSQTGLNNPEGPCLAGYYCNNGSQSDTPVSETYGDECPEGFYCPQQSHTPTPCPEGSYNPDKRRIDSSSCADCEPGTYCGTSGLAAPTGNCTAGFYCTLGAVSSSPSNGSTGGICPEGFYCPTGSHTPLACRNGTYANHTGATECYTCPAGYYCIDGINALFCKAGFYCPEGTGADLLPCPQGRFSVSSGLPDVTACTNCDGGKYCHTQGLALPTGNCSAGYYCTEGRSYFVVFVGSH